MLILLSTLHLSLQPTSTSSTMGFQINQTIPTILAKVIVWWGILQDGHCCRWALQVWQNQRVSLVCLFQIQLLFRAFNTLHTGTTQPKHQNDHTITLNGRLLCTKLRTDQATDSAILIGTTLKQWQLHQISTSSRLHYSLQSRPSKLKSQNIYSPAQKISKWRRKCEMESVDKNRIKKPVICGSITTVVWPLPDH